MGRGLSKQQHRILGLAYTVNAFTQGGTATVKAGKPVPHYPESSVDYSGAKDLKTSLAVYALSGIMPERDVLAGVFRGTKQYKSAKASTSRAITRLRERGLLVIAPNYTASNEWGYVLTPAGLEIGKDNPVTVHEIEAALCLFCIAPCEPFFEWLDARINERIPWENDIYNFAHSSRERDVLIDRIRSLPD